MCIQRGIPPKGVGFPIRKSPDQSLLAAPRGLSQRATSFIASRCQGIHQMPFSRLRFTSVRREKPKPHGHSTRDQNCDLQGSSKTQVGTVRDQHTYLRCKRSRGREWPLELGRRRTGAIKDPGKSRASRLGREPREGGGDRDRTDDLLLAKQMPSQLSYAPVV